MLSQASGLSTAPQERLLWPLHLTRLQRCGRCCAGVAPWVLGRAGAAGAVLCVAADRLVKVLHEHCGEDPGYVRGIPVIGLGVGTGAVKVAFWAAYGGVWVTRRSISVEL